MVRGWWDEDQEELRDTIGQMTEMNAGIGENVREIFWADDQDDHGEGGFIGCLRRMVGQVKFTNAGSNW